MVSIVIPFQITISDTIVHFVNQQFILTGVSGGVEGVESVTARPQAELGWGWHAKLERVTLVLWILGSNKLF